MGHLQFVKGSLSEDLTASSRRNQVQDDSDPQDRVYTFTAALRCNASGCQETVRVAGTGCPQPTEAYDEDGPYMTLEDTFKPLFFHPALMLFQPPKKTPEAVIAQLKRSFQLFFCDPSAAANGLRSAIECLFDELRIPKSVAGRGSHLLTLHQRISKVPNKHQVHTDLFEAVKWLGNAGSHRTGLKADDVLDGYEIMEHVLTELYQNKGTYVRTIAKQIIRRKGPRQTDLPRKRRRPIAKPLPPK
jgi:hypothetical protein